MVIIVTCDITFMQIVATFRLESTKHTSWRRDQFMKWHKEDLKSIRVLLRWDGSTLKVLIVDKACVNLL